MARLEMRAITETGLTGLRNILVHQYTEVNVTRIWLIIEQDLPDLYYFVQEKLKKHP